MKTGSSNTTPNASSMREAKDRYSLILSSGSIEMLPYSVEKEAERGREDEAIAEVRPAHEEEGGEEHERLDVSTSRSRRGPAR